MDVTAIGQLNQMKELYLQMNDWGPLLVSLQPLCNLQKLGKVEFELKGQLDCLEFLTQSASVQSLEHLKIVWFTSDKASVDGLSRFKKLLNLSLVCGDPPALDVSDKIWQRLHRLQ